MSSSSSRISSTCSDSSTDKPRADSLIRNAFLPVDNGALVSSANESHLLGDIEDAGNLYAHLMRLEPSVFLVNTPEKSVKMRSPSIEHSKGSASLLNSYPSIEKQDGLNLSPWCANMLDSHIDDSELQIKAQPHSPEGYLRQAAALICSDRLKDARLVLRTALRKCHDKKQLYHTLHGLNQLERDSSFPWDEEQ